jgi:hypothetical protein
MTQCTPLNPSFQPSFKLQHPIDSNIHPKTHFSSHQKDSSPHFTKDAAPFNLSSYSLFGWPTFTSTLFIHSFTSLFCLPDSAQLFILIFCADVAPCSISSLSAKSQSISHFSCASFYLNSYRHFRAFTFQFSRLGKLESATIIFLSCPGNADISSCFYDASFGRLWRLW